MNPFAPDAGGSHVWPNLGRRMADSFGGGLILKRVGEEIRAEI